MLSCQSVDYSTPNKEKIEKLLRVVEMKSLSHKHTESREKHINQASSIHETQKCLRHRELRLTILPKCRGNKRNIKRHARKIVHRKPKDSAPQPER